MFTPRSNNYRSSTGKWVLLCLAPLLGLLLANGLDSPYIPSFPAGITGGEQYAPEATIKIDIWDIKPDVLEFQLHGELFYRRLDDGGSGEIALRLRGKLGPQTARAAEAAPALEYDWFLESSADGGKTYSLAHGSTERIFSGTVTMTPPIVTLHRIRLQLFEDGEVLDEDLLNFSITPGQNSLIHVDYGTTFGKPVTIAEGRLLDIVDGDPATGALFMTTGGGRAYGMIGSQVILTYARDRDFGSVCVDAFLKKTGSNGNTGDKQLLYLNQVLVDGNVVLDGERLQASAFGIYLNDAVPLNVAAYHVLGKDGMAHAEDHSSRAIFMGLGLPGYPDWNWLVDPDHPPPPHPYTDQLVAMIREQCGLYNAGQVTIGASETELRTLLNCDLGSGPITVFKAKSLAEENASPSAYRILNGQKKTFPLPAGTRGSTITLRFNNTVRCDHDRKGNGLDRYSLGLNEVRVFP